ncbi:MAG: polyprenyl synthetase family protein [Pyrinomonadaceae bacterium]|nr:polyprenyl synthetase family protein [Pyrinomonadaceae bacterium]
MTTSPETIHALDIATHMELRQFLSDARSRIDAKLDRLLPRESVEPVKLHAAIRWSVFAGGKRFRPLLTLAVGETFGIVEDKLLPTACALELIHTYSLIHDDLPSMDNDDLRRGRATCHIQFDEATAILAGDALQTLAFKIVSEDKTLSAEKRLRLIADISSAAGTPQGMVAGQALDLDAESRNVSAEELEQIHRLKTAALIITSARCGAIIADVTESDLEAVTEYAAQLGLLFQITDDLLDITATAEAIGKTPGKDRRSEKATYPHLHGIDAARDLALTVHARARAAVNQIERSTQHLSAIADYILNRTA